MKRALLAMIAAIMVLSSLAACSGKNEGKSSDPASGEQKAKIDETGKYSDPVVISIGRSIDANYKFPGDESQEDNFFTRWLKDRYNIVFKHEWEASNGNDYNQKVNLSISSNDLPDAMVVNESQLKQMIKADQLADLSEVYQQYASDNLKSIYNSNPKFLESVTFDGKMYALPETTLPSAPMTWIRKDWLDKLGLQPPQNIQDLEKIAKAFVDNKMGGENTIGIIGTAQGGKLNADFLNSTAHNFNFTTLFFANKAYPGFWVEGNDGKATYGSTLPETKQALAMLREWYANGILDKELALRKSTEEAIIAGKAGIYFGSWWTPYSIQDLIKNDPEANWRPYVAPLDAEGNFNSNEVSGSSYVVVRKGYEHADAVIRYHNIRADKDASYEEAIGNRSLTSQETPLFTILENGDQIDYAVSSLEKYLAGEISLEDVNKKSYGFVYQMVEHAKNVKKEPMNNYDIQYWDKASDEFFIHVYAHLNGGSELVKANIKPFKSLVNSKTPTMESRWQNLQKLEEETFLKIITGKSSVDEFDSFVQKWNEQGGQQITEEVRKLLE